MTPPDHAAGPAPVRLRLYVSGNSPRTPEVIESVTALCARALACCRLEVIDIVERPELALQDGVPAVPALVRAGDPPRIVVGDFGDPRRVIRELGLSPGGLEGG